MSLTEATNDHRAEAAVRLDQVKFSWSGRSPFSMHVDDLTLMPGEHLFMFGQSGSGKSTLLSLICGINEPDAGQIHVGGRKLSQMSGRHRDRFRAENIGIIFQMFNLLPYASPLDNILLPLRFAPARRHRMSNLPETEALALAERLGLPQSLVRHAASSDLSVGQQQRVAVARALIGQPSLIVADEPTSSLDATAQQNFLDLLIAQIEDTATTLIMVSHDMRLADRFDRVVDLADIASTSREPST